MTIAASPLEAFSVLPNPRLARGKEHRWSELLFVAVYTLLTGGESCYDLEEFAGLREEWLRTFLALPGGPPSHDTFTGSSKPWTRRHSPRRSPPGPGACGPPCPRAHARSWPWMARRRALNAGKDTRYLVNAWATENGLTLGQVQGADKSNEITAVPALRRALELTGCIVTADALHCQKNTAK